MNDILDQIDNIINYIINIKLCGSGADDFREIADSLINKSENNKPENNKSEPDIINMIDNNDFNNLSNIGVKIKVNSNYEIIKIMVRTEPKECYFTVPLSFVDNNPFYIQNILNKYTIVFNNKATFKDKMYMELADRYNKSVTWLEEEVEWIKFTSENGKEMIPTGYRRYSQ